MAVRSRRRDLGTLAGVLFAASPLALSACAPSVGQIAKLPFQVAGHSLDLAGKTVDLAGKTAGAAAKGAQLVGESRSVASRRIGDGIDLTSKGVRALGDGVRVIEEDRARR
jgi:hypothetical protein